LHTGLDLTREIFGSRNDRLLKQYRKDVVAQASTRWSRPQFEKLSDDALRAKTDEFKRGGQRRDAGRLLPEAFAVVREGPKRV
jgi:preprotein translocase subunit SecA